MELLNKPLTSNRLTCLPGQGAQSNQPAATPAAGSSEDIMMQLLNKPLDCMSPGSKQKRESQEKAAGVTSPEQDMPVKRKSLAFRKGTGEEIDPNAPVTKQASVVFEAKKRYSEASEAGPLEEQARKSSAFVEAQEEVAEAAMRRKSSVKSSVTFQEASATSVDELEVEEDELVPNPDECPCFTPNTFKKDKCKNCGHSWLQHKGVISTALLGTARASVAITKVQSEPIGSTIELIDNPDECPSFAPNKFNPEKCKNCGHAWREHKGVISKRFLTSYTATAKMVEDQDVPVAVLRQRWTRAASKGETEGAEGDEHSDETDDEAHEEEHDEDVDLGAVPRRTLVRQALERMGGGDEDLPAAS